MSALLPTHVPAARSVEPEGAPMHCPRCGFDTPEDLPLLGRVMAQATSINFLFGCHAEARAELSAAIMLYRSMVMTFWLPQAEAALAQVEGR